MAKRYYTIFMLGTAGSGKTVLTRTLLDWFNEKKLDVITLNLDAGVRRLPYNPDIDARDIVNIDHLTDKLDLGPNGAMIASMDLIATKVDTIRDEIDYIKPEYLLIDTPGQIELFAYRSSGRLISSVIAEGSQPASIFLIDPSLALRPEGFSSILLLSVSVAFQLALPQITAISKSDIIEKAQMENLDNWIDSPESLVTDLQSSGKVSLSQQLGMSIIDILQQFKSTGDLLPISSNTGHNIDTLIALLERDWGQRDDFYE
ncbi:MAG: ATP/GTP-binding protein [Candidatus Heimdallarchaeota archaeon]|nr:GTPase [Candidatus Heimdallarchaeota archaeon]MCG3255231.1 ATP/GTP-binding protein [Candidatus Heimdallarchaeota archaeon]MCK4610303.1 ATP/GTP-binding protein [Candidatus Heimdallarchaeota archaeon]